MNLILDQKQIHQKIKRIAYEIYENNFDEKEMIIAGIYDKGYDLAILLEGHLKEISNFNLKLIKITLDKQSPLTSSIEMDAPMESFAGRCVVLVDDVLNTGRTVAASMKVLLGSDLKKLELAVLVARSHKLFPVMAQYKGYELATAISEHVEVSLKEEMSVHLS